jgi:hypothetical protein
MAKSHSPVRADDSSSIRAIWIIGLRPTKSAMETERQVFSWTLRIIVYIAICEMKSTGQVAREIGVNKGTLLRWLRDEILPEPKRIEIAGPAWRTWTEADVKRAKKLKAAMRRGPKPKDRKKGPKQ